MASIQGIYIALFGRPADPAGLAFFNEATNNGSDLTAIGDLAATAEYQDRFVGMSNEEIVQSIYQSLFERDGDADGVQFFVDGLEDGTFSINDIAIRILDGAQGTDLDTVNAKIEAADLFLERLDLDEEIEAYDGATAADIARSFFDSVDTNNVPDEAAIDALIQDLLTQEGQGPGGGNGGGGNSGDFIPPEFDLGNTVNISVDENIAGVDLMVYTAVATDNSGQIQSLVLGGVDAGEFTFDQATGQLTFNSSPDFEAQSSYNVEITAMDWSGNETVQTVTIDIDDVAENQTHPIASTGNHSITDFAAGDTIDLSGIDAKQTWILDLGWLGSYPQETGDQDFTFAGAGSNAGFGEIVVTNDGVNTYVRGDTTVAPGADDLVITITGVHALDGSNFIL